MKVLWALLSENVIVNERTNNVSLVEVIEELTIPAQPPHGTDVTGQEPNTLYNSWLSILFARSDPQVSEMGHSQARMVTPSGREAVFLDINVDLTQHPRSRSMVRMNSFPLPLSERRRVRIQSRDHVRPRSLGRGVRTAFADQHPKGLNSLP